MSVLRMDKPRGAPMKSKHDQNHSHRAPSHESKWISGIKDWPCPVRFDVHGWMVGITQIIAGKEVVRVQLTGRQFTELVRFVEGKGNPK